MKNTLLKSFVCCALLFIGFSCGGGGELSTTPLAISTSFIETDVLGSTTTITVDAPRDWYAATTGEKWIRLTPSSGKAGKTEMKVTIKPNDSGKSRTAQITFNAGQDKEIIDVQQEWGYYFTLPCTEYTIGYGGGEIIVNGLPKSGFAITTSVAAQSWIKVIGNKLKVSFNDGKTSRNAVLNIKDNSAGKTYEVLLFQESSSGADNILALKEFTIDGYNCPSDSFTPASDFFYSVDMDATTTSKTAKVTFSGEGVEWITIGDNTKKIKSGDTVTFEDMTANTKIKILTHNSLTDKVGQNFLIISGLPLVVINSQGIIVDEPKVDCTFSIFDPKARTDAEEKNLVYFESLAGIEFRGAGAQRYPKKPYNFKLRDSNGNKREAEILNIRNDNSWILDAMYLDMARMRNRVCFDLWNTFNKPYYVDEKPKALSGTRGHYVEVFVNGEYMGLFILSDRIDRKQYQLEQNGGYIYKYVVADGSCSKVNITLSDINLAARSEFRTVSGRACTMSPDGERALVVARGEIFSVPAQKGAVYNLTNTPDGHERDAAWSPDGKWIAYFSDKSGEYQLYILDTEKLHDPESAKAVTSFKDG
ncbi:MAG: CotH kinase family protein, partial [Alistipes sp.]|nr:CotH kinase family protein [Alistipes sp.]